MNCIALHFFIFRIFFLMWAILKVFIECVTILLLFYVFVFCSQGMWDLSSPTIETAPPALEGKILTSGPPEKSKKGPSEVAFWL